MDVDTLNLLLKLFKMSQDKHAIYSAVQNEITNRFYIIKFENDENFHHLALPVMWSGVNVDKT